MKMSLFNVKKEVYLMEGMQGIVQLFVGAALVIMIITVIVAIFVTTFFGPFTAIPAAILTAYLGYRKFNYGRFF
jgi:hypothetical protein